MLLNDSFLATASLSNLCASFCSASPRIGRKGNGEFCQSARYLRVLDLEIAATSASEAFTEEVRS